MKKVILNILILGFLLMFLPGCKNRVDDEEMNFEEDADILVIKNSMSEEEMKSYVERCLEKSLVYYGEITSSMDYLIGKDDGSLKYSVNKASIYFDKDNSIIYIVDFEKNKDLIKNIGKEEFESYTIEDVLNNNKIKFNSYKINEYSVDKYDDTDEYFIQFKEKDNADFWFKVMESDNYILYGNKSFTMYYFFDYEEAETDLLNRYYNVKNKYSKSEPEVGMTREEVKKSSWGEPDEINEEKYSWGVGEQWVYKKHGYIYLKNGIVTSISKR